MVRHAFTLRYPDQPPPVLKQIYNENARLSANEREGRNSIQHMLHLCNEANYISDYMSDPVTKALTSVWVAHPEAVEMLKAWPNVVCIDSTYNTNKYGLVLVQCVGVTPVGKSFLIGYALIKRENTEGYTWVLRRLESFMEPHVRPTVIVTDHERGLMAALPTVFGTSHHFLCLFHVYMAVETYATRLEKNGNFGKAVAHGSWKKVVEAETLDECNRQFEDMKKKYRRHPLLIEYFMFTWWPNLHKFAKCFTNQIVHFGNTTTSRVEYAHAQLKMWLGSAELSLDNLWKRADVMMKGQHIEIRKTLEDSISKSVVANLYHGKLFSMLSGRVSATAIEAMLNEFRRGTDLGDYVDDLCGCTLWSTHNLLCACRLHDVSRRGRMVHPGDIHVFWSRLGYTDSSHCRYGPNVVMEELFNKVRGSHQSIQKDVIESLFAKLFPENDVVEEPEVNENKRGRPRKSNARNKSAFEHARRSFPSTSTSTDGGDGLPLDLSYDGISHIGVFPYEGSVPEAVVDGFLDAFDPEGDGHCGFRVISHAKTGREQNYLHMRDALLTELKKTIYDTVYYGQKKAACRRIKWAQRKPCMRANWMEANDLFGFATMYHWTICLVTSWTNERGERVWTGSNTYHPLQAVPGVRNPYGILWILFTGNHFVRLRLKDDCAMPPIHPHWVNNREENIDYYENLHTERHDLWWQFVFSGAMWNPFDEENHETEVLSD